MEGEIVDPPSNQGPGLSAPSLPGALPGVSGPQAVSPVSRVVRARPMHAGLEFPCVHPLPVELPDTRSASAREQLQLQSMARP